MDIVPHHELVEREQSEQRLLHHVPAMHVLHPFPHSGKDALHIYTMVICGQRIQHTQVDLELLLQQLYQGGIDDGILFTGTDHIVGTRTAHDIHRHQQYWGVASQHALVVLVPFQHTDGHEQRVRTILLQ